MTTRPRVGRNSVPPRRLCVLQSVPEPHDRQNPYLSLLAAALPADVDVVWFSWGRALFGRYQVVHSHWPELAMRAPTSMRRAFKRALFALWLTRLALTRTPIVRTVHNAQPHDPGASLERWLLLGFDARTSSWIRMNDETPVPTRARSALVPHGHYRDWFAAFEPQPDREPGHLVFFGLIRPYKGVEDLLTTFSGLDDTHGGRSLHVVGHAEDRGLRRQVSDAARSDPRITAELTYVDDATLYREVSRAQLVVLPFRRLLNSGTVLLALSLDRPVLVPRGPVTDALAVEVGTWWVQRFDPPLTVAQLDAAVLATDPSRAPRGRPDLHQREWAELGRQIRDEYLAVMARRQPRRYSE